jgi:hypothetical protein
MQLSTQIRKGGLKELVLQSEEPGQPREWQWGVLHLKGHKDVPLVTFQFCRRRIRRQSCARSVIVYTRDPTRGQPRLAIGVASLVTSVRIAWARELLINL